MNKIYRLFILAAFISTAGVFAFADQPSSSLDDKPSVDTAASNAVQVPAVPADTSAANTGTSYLYDLKKLIDKSRENIKEVNEKIKEQAVLKRNQKREERAHEYYEKGVELTNEGKLDEARDYFEKAIRITEHPEMVGYIKESQRRLRKQESALQSQERQHNHQIKEDENARKEDVEAAYKVAVDLYKQKKYHPAKDAFEHVDEIAPDYRATSSYLKIIDQDIIMADALAVKQQAAEVQRQQKEAEAARAKEKAMWLAQIEEKEKEHKEAIDKQAQDVYDEAVVLYKNKKFAEAKKKFEEVSWVIPNYKDTMKYLGRIDRDAEEEKARVAKEQQKALQEQQWEEVVAQKKRDAERQRELAVKDRRQMADLQEQAQFLYTAAVSLYDKQNMDEALEKFNDIDKLLPDYKSTRAYIARINQWKFDEQKKLGIVSPDQGPPSAPDVAQTPGVLPAPVAPPQAQSSMPAKVKIAVSLEDQQKQTQEISDLAERSVQLYRQIADMADDNSTNQMKRKMARLEDLLNNLKEGKERLLRRMRHELWESQQGEERSRLEQHRAEAEKMYQMAQEYLSSRDYAKAKIQFLALENLIPDYKATRRYLSRIEEYQKNAGAEVVTSYENAEAEHLKQLQDKENAAELLRAQKEQEEERVKEQKEQATLQNYIQTASDLNDDIIRLARQQDFEGMKAKFTDLENVVTAFMVLKDEMIKQKNSQEHERQLARESANERANMLKAQKREDQEIHAYGSSLPLQENRPVLSNQPSDAQYYKNRDIMQEQNMLFNEGVDRYEHKKYSQAKLLFGELADQHDRRAEIWLKKVDRAITRELLNSEVGEEKERTAFIEDQVKAQRQLIIIQERERQRQKKLTEELEQQKRLYEDDRLLQLRKEETMKAQERERQQQEEKRLRLEKESEKQQEMFRFHKVETPPAKQPEAKPQTAQPVAVTSPVASTSKAVAPSAVSATQAQIDFSNRRKEFLDDKYKKEQQEKARQDKIKADADARQKRVEERQKERERQKELKIQHEEERRAKLKEEAAAKAEKLAQEQKHRGEFMHQQELEREEKIKQDKIMREENERRETMEREERERQAQLETRRAAVRKELEDGVEAMYQEALSLYKQGDFTSAADKFKDVQDIIPGYKRSEQFMDEARQKSLNPPSVITSDMSEGPTNVTSSSAAGASSSPVSHQDSVSKALDLFDPDAK